MKGKMFVVVVHKVKSVSGSYYTRTHTHIYIYIYIYIIYTYMSVSECVCVIHKIKVERNTGIYNIL